MYSLEAEERIAILHDEEGNGWWEHGVVLVPAGAGALVLRVHLDVAGTTLLLEITPVGSQDAGPRRTAVLDRAEDAMEIAPDIV